MTKAQPTKLALMIALLSANVLAYAAADAEQPTVQTAEQNSDEQKRDEQKVHTLAPIIIVGSAAKDGEALLEQPLSTSVIDQEQLKESGADKLDNALFYEAGVLAQPYGADNKSQWFKIRGFDASQTLDGTALAPNGFFVWEPEVYGLERIEMVKGASSFNYGASETGGNVN